MRYAARVLVVEDEMLIRIHLAEDLRLAGFEVVEAATADAALIILEAIAKIDLIISDIRMHGILDGLALAQIVRSRWPQIKIMLVSGHLVAMPIENCDAFFEKPYTPVSVIKHVKTLLGLNCV